MIWPRYAAACAALLLGLASAAPALDIGGSLDNATGFTYEADGEPVITQRDKLGLWFDLEIGQYLNLLVEGSALFTIEDPYFYFDAESVKFEGDFPAAIGEFGIFRFDLGRFQVSDFTRNVLSHNVDGVNLELGLPFAVFSASFGYTGFLFKHSANITMSQADENDGSEATRYLAPPRLVGTVHAKLPELFLRQTLDIAFLYQFDLRDQYDLVYEGDTDLTTTGGRLTSQYSGVGFSGPLVHPLYYNAFFYLGTGMSMSYVEDTASTSGYSYRYRFMLTFLAGAALKLYLTELLFSKIELKFLLASGDQDYSTYFLEGNTSGTAGTFVAISSPSLALVFNPKLGNIYLFDLSYSFKPFSKTGSLVMENFQTTLKGIAYLRATTGQISEAYINPDSSVPYLGTEIDAIFNFRPSSDLGMSLSYGIFFPNAGADGAFLQGVKKIEMLGRFELSFGF